MLRLTRAIHDTSHYGNLKLFDTMVALLPSRHLLSQISLNLVGHILEKRIGGAPAARASCHLGHEAANSQRLEDLLGNSHLFGAIAVWKRREGDADRIAD